MHKLVFFYFAILCSLLTLFFVSAHKSQYGISIDLIHRDSPLSPFHNSSMTPSESIKNAALRSMSRSNRVLLSLDANTTLGSTIVPDMEGGEYLMKFYIGTPLVERLAFLDTGSDLIWVQCYPCVSCFAQNSPIFDPKNSSTFKSLSCDTNACTFLSHQCGNSRECNYFYSYGDNSSTSGHLGIETIAFENITIPDFVFGCGLNNSFAFKNENKTTGIVGLGGGPLSLISQVGSEIGFIFSYCLLPPSENSTSKLKIGNDAIISGKGVVSTPLITNSSTPTYYYVNLKGITVGQKTVETGESGGNIIIDSGTTLTYLKPSFYNNFVVLVKEAIGVDTIQNPPSPYNFCFINKANMNFPSFEFHFDGASVPLDATKNLFTIINDLYCLEVVPFNTDNIGLAIFGNKAQIDIQVGFDLEGKKVSFAPTDCTKI
ncbi:aspartic proteinase CDR1-like [Abrus precatorius]|uniref:Aspartic proteinase CDR1-like n=1 Tax=Abrus precatorius TaxID=3816 RepID=A0A8B8KID6_ABRPR|nr:aspartic proteinase CDR1-like [Abrus precatorius]